MCARACYMISSIYNAFVTNPLVGHISYKGVQKTEILFGFGYKKIRIESEPYKNLTSVLTVFRQKLRAIRSSYQVTKITLLVFSVQIKNVLKHDRNRV